MPKVYVVGSYMSQYTAMFRRQGWDAASNIKAADLVQFTGGEDVSPSLYGHSQHKNTYANADRDRKEQIIFELCLKDEKPMAGICRGGQFLNVMCGGKMVQHCDGHGVSGGHEARDERTGEVFNVSSTHHQMMVPHNQHAEVIITARRSTWCEKHINERLVHYNTTKTRDIEALWYPKFNSFCFQPHPELPGWNALADRYFCYLQEFFGLCVPLFTPAAKAPELSIIKQHI
jgi:gamma-glutamyl-gamma-aminobutyrate hydrolase PuuD